MLSCSAALALGCGDTKGPSDAGTSDARAPAERVLFVGNSYTYYHDMPDMVRSIAEASGLRLDVEMIAPGGATLRDHWNSSGARERVEEGFDAVVIQAQSTETLSPAFDDAARLFADAIQEAGSRGVWYSHWGRRDLETHADQIEAAYSRAAATHGHAVARVGEAFLIAERRHPEVALLGPDGSHPSPEGSLLAACVLFQSITGVSPRVPPGITGLPDLVAQSICSIANDGVPCDSVQSLCGGECVSWSVDACGGCDVRCDEGDPCLAGVCGCGDGPLTGCDGTCVDLRSSRLHCGACGVECALLETCVEGSCSCPEGLVQSTYLSFAEPIECVSFLLAMEREETLECKESIHESCRAIGGERGCFASGFGPATGSSGIGNQYVRCVQAEVSTTSYSELALWVPECEPGTLSQACTSAIHRWCVSRGARTGFGPVSVAGEAIEVSCLRDATLVRATHAEVSESHCAADPVRCSVAAWDACVARGHSSGFGPVEAFGDEVEIACVD